MGVFITPAIEAEVRENCTEIYALDTTTYLPIMSKFDAYAYTNAYAKVFILYKDDGTGTYPTYVDSTVYEADIGPVNHTFTVTNGEKYVVLLALIPVVGLKSYTIGSLVSYEDDIYEAVSAPSVYAGSGAPAAPDWVLVSVPSTYKWKIIIASAITYPDRIIDPARNEACWYVYKLLETACQLNPECEDFTITRTGCASFLIDDNVAVGYERTVDIYAFGEYPDGTPEETFTMDTGEAQLPLDLTTYTDGVYMVKITYTILTDVYTYWYVVYKLCDLISCLKLLINGILCREWDPCCEECDAATIESYRRKRLEINKMIAMAGIIFANVHSDLSSYLGISSEIESDRLNLISLTSAMIDKMVIIVERCGECDGATEESGCSECNDC